MASEEELAELEKLSANYVPEQKVGRVVPRFPHLFPPGRSSLLIPENRETWWDKGYPAKS